MFKVYVSPNEVWGYFQDNKKRFGNKVVSIAEFTDDENTLPVVRLYLAKKNGYPLLTVEKVCGGGREEVLAESCATSKCDCISKYRELLGQLKSCGEIILKEHKPKEIELQEAIASFFNTFCDLCIDECKHIEADNERLEYVLDDIKECIYNLSPKTRKVLRSLF